MLHRYEVNQAELDVRGDVDQHVDVALRSRCAPRSRPKQRQRPEPTLPQRPLERFELGMNVLAFRGLAPRVTGRGGFPSHQQSKRLANHLAGIAVETRVHFAANVPLELWSKRYVHGSSSKLRL